MNAYAKARAPWRPLGRALWLPLAIALAAAGAAGCECASFPYEIDPSYACTDDTDCAAWPGRSCVEGWCVLPGTDSGVGDAGPVDCTIDDDCAALTQGCVVGVCTAAGTCATSNAPDGTACDDGEYCVENEACFGGACTGVPVACTPSGPCVTAACDESIDACAETPVAAGSACDDGLYCTETDACDATGTCTGGPRDCSAVEDDCNGSMCDEAGQTCVAVPLADGTVCDDGLFCTDPDACLGGACAAGARDCSAVADDCNTASCDEGADACAPVPVADGTLCDDGLFCTDPDACTGGACGAPARDCSAVANTCNTASCDETADACAPVPVVDGTACSDGLSCTLADACTAGACGGAPVMCAGDAWACTVEACSELAGGCDVTVDESVCGAGEVCNVVAYAASASGCGPAPAALSVACPATSPAGTPVTCSVGLVDGVGTGVPGEAGRIACTATSSPLQLFSDDFTGGFDPLWVPATGTPSTNTTIGGDEAAFAATAWQSDVTLDVTGLDTVCIDFDAAQNNSGSGERIRWDVAFDGGAFSTVFDLDFDVWEDDNLMHQFNLNVCVAVPGGAGTVTLRLRMSGASTDEVWVDDVVVTGLAAPFTNPPGGGPDAFAGLTGWTTVSGTPQVGSFAGSSVLWAEGETFVIERTVDATACDVLDVDFEFGQNNADAGDSIRLEVSVDGGAFSTIELIDFTAGVWNVNNAWLPWLGLRRVTDLFPAAAGSANVVFRFTLVAAGGGDRIYVDDFEVTCADLPDPVVGAVTDAGAGVYDVSLDASGAQVADLQCLWVTADDGPLSDSDAVLFTTP